MEGRPGARGVANVVDEQAQAGLMLTVRRTKGEWARNFTRLNYTQCQRSGSVCHVTKQSNSIVRHACVGDFRRVSADIRIPRERPELLLQEPVGARQGAGRWQGGRSRGVAAPDGPGRVRHRASGSVPPNNSELLLFELTFAKASDKPVILMRPFGANAVMPKEITSLSDQIVDWDGRALVDADQGPGPPRRIQSLGHDRVQARLASPQPSAANS